MPKRSDRRTALPKGLVLAVLLGLTALLSPLGSPRAHPHVWIDVSLELSFQGNVLKGLRVVWLFDEYYSAFAVQDFDVNGNKRLDREELAILENGHEGLKEYSYFTHLKIGALLPDNLKVEAVENFVAEMNGDRLQYAFDVPLPENLDPRETTFGVGFYDETYYIDLNVGSPRKLRVTGNLPGGCRPALVEDKLNPIYFGMVNPLYVQIGCDVS
ncbi:MAG: DUF1007 family protein [Kiloniellales bacterium]|nr:DUF1007 family protein [Kiloniellales bacterium]